MRLDEHRLRQAGNVARQVQRHAGDPAVPFGRVPSGAELREDSAVRAAVRAADRRRRLHADGQGRHQRARHRAALGARQAGQPRGEHRMELRRHLHLRRARPAARPLPPRRLAGRGCDPAPDPGLSVRRLRLARSARRLSTPFPPPALRRGGGGSEAVELAVELAVEVAVGGGGGEGGVAGAFDARRRAPHHT